MIQSPNATTYNIIIDHDYILNVAAHYKPSLRDIQPKLFDTLPGSPMDVFNLKNKFGKELFGAFRGYMNISSI